MDPKTIEAFVGTVVSDFSAAVSGVLVNLGHKLGLYRAMAGAGPLTSAELARRTGLAERYVREWLHHQAAGGYVTYEPSTATFELPPEHAFVLADDRSPAFFAPAFDTASSVWLDEDLIAEAFRTGRGVAWGEHHHRLFHSTEAFFRNAYRAHLASQGIPALEGVDARLRAGGRAADVGCGHGAALILLAHEYPRAELVGYDSHEASIEVARQRAREAGVDDRVRFEVAPADRIELGDYDLVCFLDAFHDLGDPLGAARRAREALAPGGALMLVEPIAADRPEANRGPIARLFYGMSTLACTPNAVAQGARDPLGAQAGEARLRAILGDAGFSAIRRAAETPTNMVLEARA